MNGSKITTTANMNGGYVRSFNNYLITVASAIFTSFRVVGL